jgi:hypothetical protein
MTTKTTKPRELIYLGARVTQHEVRTAGAAGPRAVVTTWHDKGVGQPTEWAAGTTVIRFIKGDGMRGTLVIIAPEVVLEPGTDAGFISDYVAQGLGL